MASTWSYQIAAAFSCTTCLNWRAITRDGSYVQGIHHGYSFCILLYHSIATTLLTFLLCLTSQILNLARLSAIGRYHNLFVFLCYDKDPTPVNTRHIVLLQTATFYQEDVAPTWTHFKTVSPQTLAAGMAETILAQVHGVFNDEILQSGIERDDLLRQRAHFLLTLVPSLCARGAVQCIQLARTLFSNGIEDQEHFAFGALFKNPQLRQQIHLASTNDPSYGDVHPDAMIQLEHAISVCISGKRGP